MSSSKIKDQSVEEIEGKPGKETERCGTGRTSKLPTRARSPSVSGQKSKIPTNVGQAGRPSTVNQSQVQDHLRPLTSVASDDTAAGNPSPLNSGRFSTSKSLTIASSQPAALNTPKGNKSSIVSIGNSAMLKRHLETQFAMKKKRYVTLKKELTDRQKNAIDLYDEMSQLREKLMANGAKDPGKIETINLTGIPVQSCPTHLPIEPQNFRIIGDHVFTQNSSITRELVSTIESKIREISKRHDEFCEITFQKRSEILETLVKLEGSKIETEIDSEIVKQIETFKNENLDLAKSLEETKKSNEIETNEMIKKISSIWNEVEVSRERIFELDKMRDEMTKECRVKLDAVLMEKKLIEEKFEQTRERRATLETELQKSRLKIRGMETRINEDENKISQLQSNMKNLEMQLKQKESSAERLKEMQKSLKNSESILAKTEKQRDSFESRLNELKKNFNSKEKEAEKKMKELTEKFDAVNAELAKERGESQTRKGANEVDENFERSTIDNRLAERDEKIATLEREKKDIIRIINPDLLNDGSSSTFDEGDNVHEKIMAELTKKMQDLRLNFKMTQERNDSLQRQLTEFRSHVSAQSKECDKSFWSDRVMELEKQVYELRLSITELTRRNEDLEIALNQKRLEIEEQDRIMRERNNVLKVRDEVIDLIKGKPESRGNNVESGHLSLVKKKNNQRDREQVDKQIAEKTENLQQLYSTLETKQMQITRLEQLVQQMEIQQERAQEQRTRLEKKIAQLQLAMHYKKGHRYVSPESPKVSTMKVSSPTFRDLSQKVEKSMSGVQTLKNSSFPPPRSSSRSSKLPRSPLRHQPQQMQRSKTLNSFNSKARTSSSKIYPSHVMDEVARVLKRERDYDYKKRAIARDDIASGYSMEDRGSVFIVNNNDVLDDLEISKEDIHESFYNWLVEPWMFEGSPSDEHCHNDLRRANRSINSTSSFNVRTDNRSPFRGQHRAINDCSRESRCDSPECRRCTVTEWNCSSDITTRARTSPQEITKHARSRRQRS